MARDQLLQLRASAEQRQLIDQAAVAEGISRTEFILRSCQERARDVLLDRTLFSLTRCRPGSGQHRTAARHAAALACARLSPSAASIS
jgi:hypothetical protein